MTHDQFEKEVQDIPTLFTKHHAHIVYGLIRWLRPQTILEIGCFHGYMTAWMAKANQDNGGNGVVFALDNFSLGNSPVDLHNNLAQLNLSNRVQVFAKDSKNGIPSAELVFIDGDHSYDGCRTDFINAVNNGAQCIIVHDTRSWWGPNRFVREFDSSDLSPYWYMMEVGFDQGLAVFLRKSPISSETQYTEGDFASGTVLTKNPDPQD